MKNLYFIVNPISGNANNTKYTENLIALMSEYPEVTTHMHVLSGRGEAAPYADKLSNEIGENGIIVSVGGDGTFNEIASALTGKKTAVAIVPRGSGNGLARMLKVPTTPKEQKEYLLKGKTINIDNGQLGDRKFFCTAGFGFEACIAFLFDKTGCKKRGKQQYIRHIIKEIFKYNPVEAVMEADGERIEGKYLSVCVANADQYGNNAIIAPTADINDGMLNLVMVKPFPIVIAGTMGTALMGGYMDKITPYVETRKIKSLKIISLSDEKYHCDGEPINMDLPTRISINNDPLRILVKEDFKKQSPRALDISIDDINAKIDGLTNKFEEVNVSIIETIKNGVGQLSNMNKDIQENAKELIDKFFRK